LFAAAFFKRRILRFIRCFFSTFRCVYVLFLWFPSSKFLCHEKLFDSICLTTGIGGSVYYSERCLLFRDASLKTYLFDKFEQCSCIGRAAIEQPLFSLETSSEPRVLYIPIFVHRSQSLFRSAVVCSSTSFISALFLRYFYVISTLFRRYFYV